VPIDEPRDRHPQRALHVIEVADSTVRLDLDRKARIYAAAGVPVCWVIDLPGDVVHVHTDPTPESDATVAVRGADEELDVCGVGLSLGSLRSP
jgi:Uma2 family endonuclease